MSTIQYTADDYCVYLRMSGRTHVPVANRESLTALVDNVGLIPIDFRGIDFDVISDFVRFEEPASEKDKIERIHDCAISNGINDKLYVIDDLDMYLSLGNESGQKVSENQIEISDAPTEEVNGTLRRLSDKGISIRRPEDVSSYLLRYPDMIDVVITVSEVTLGQFDDGAQLSLEVYNDPEIEDEYLTLYVRQRQYDDAYDEKLDAIQSQCNELLIGKSGWFIVTTDFSEIG